MIEAKIINPYVTHLSEPDGTIHIFAPLFLSWRDPSLAWNVTDYENLTHVSVSRDRVWCPDVGLSNAVEVVKPTDFMDHVTVDFEGRVSDVDHIFKINEF